MRIKPTTLGIISTMLQPTELISVAYYANFLGDLIFLEQNKLTFYLSSVPMSPSHYLHSLLVTSFLWM